MLKTKRNRIFLVGLVIFSMVAMYGFMPTAKAASMDSIKDTIGDSHLGATTQHEITFDLGTALAAGEYISINFGSFTGADEANITCPGVSVASTTRITEVGCVGVIASTSAQTMTVTDVTNPGTEGSYSVVVTTYTAAGVEIESSDIKVYVLSEVTVTAHVDATLTFMLAGTTTAASINGENPTIDSSASSSTLPFGDLEIDTPAIMAQEMFVTTNAQSGYTVTVQQDGNLVNGAGGDIDSFIDGTPSAGAAWISPTADIGTGEATYGHMGYTADDAGLGGGNYAGFNGSTAVTVLAHNGPADGSTINEGRGSVAYAIEVSALQEAGDYSTTLTYICTPTY